MTALCPRRFTFLLAIALVGCAAAGQAHAAEKNSADPRDTKVLRLVFDDDTFIGSDDAYTGGWSVQVHSALLDEWTPGLAGWIGRLPGLGDDGEGGRVARWAWGVSQMVFTPEDITMAAPQPDDAPWAGTLGGYVSWSSYDNRQLAALQMYLGCIGPCSHAEEAQTFVHKNLGMADPPEGWPNQLANKTLLNLNYEYRYKVWAGRQAVYGTRRWSSDLSVATQVGLGNFATFAEARIEYRFGWGVPHGFARLADPPPLGIALDPVYVDPDEPFVRFDKWRTYFDLVYRKRSFRKFAPLEGGVTQNGGYEPKIDSGLLNDEVVFGVHVEKAPHAFHLVYYHYLDDKHLSGALGQLDWVSLSFERRF
ncbi:MAG TPA: lipid A deacylase LpxR family protein [Gammaproteobacteria bacterium]|nr:lipid A deacylase LpxR family protein [Gammaproteobacteria bacterium]